jgi:hypothetical protein
MHQRVEYENHGHPGEDGLRYLHRLLLIDEAWTEWHPDGFTWWAHSLAQRYRWSGPTEVDGIPTWFFHVETDFLQGAHNREQALGVINKLNNTLGLGVGALVLEGDRIRFRSHTYALPASAPDRIRLLSAWGIITNAIASRLPTIAKLHPEHYALFDLDPTWTLDTSSHPHSGARSNPDDMLNIVGAMFIPEGSKPAPASTDLNLDGVVHALLRARIDAIGGDAAGALMANWSTPCGRVDWRIDRAFDHPLLGFGLRSRLEVTPKHANQASPAVAHHLNLLEDREPLPLIGGGAWAVDRRTRALTHTWFFPNASLRGQLATLIGASILQRIDWLEHSLPGEASGP